jgi:eukaryotic-like serine/threonine-protein kinase
VSIHAQVFSNRYEIVRELARGGMAEVYLARDLRLDRPVALKVLSAELSRDPAFVERFRREAQAAANLSHPNIVAVYDWGQEGGTYFIVMEFVDGRSLRDMIRAESPIAPMAAADIAAEIAAALAFANRNGVVHRDVKPGNVLITPAGQVQVTDFGIARSGTSESLTQTGAVMGTATYFSPEQAQGLPVDGRSDVYALGVVLYEMVTGVPPFSGDTPVSVAYKHVREDVIPPSRRVPGVPRALEQIILGAMAKDPERRYQSADELRADLLRFRRDRPIAGTPLTAMVTAITGTTGAASAATVATPAFATAPPTPPGRRRQNRRGAVAVIVLSVLLVGAIVALIVSQVGGGSGVGTAAVPNVSSPGLNVDVATRALKQAGFKVRVDRKPNATVPKDVVFSQDPEAGTKLKKGQPVTITVSNGPGDVTVPDVAGQSAADAKAQLDALGFIVQIRPEPSDTRVAGLVTRTDPPAAANIPKGSTITVFVSAGPAPVPIPNVVGVDQVAAANQLGALGFKVTTQPQASDTVPVGNVISTDPAAGTPAPKGATIKLVVSTGPEQVSVPDVTDKKSSTAADILTTAGFQVNTISVPSTPARKDRVISQTPQPGTAVNKGATITITVGDGQLPPGTTG